MPALKWVLRLHRYVIRPLTRRQEPPDLSDQVLLPHRVCGNPEPMRPIAQRFVERCFAFAHDAQLPQSAHQLLMFDSKGATVLCRAGR